MRRGAASGLGAVRRGAAPTWWAEAKGAEGRRVSVEPGAPACGPVEGAALRG